MTSLFDPITVGAINAPNRIMMAPLTRARATRSHVPTPPAGLMSVFTLSALQSVGNLAVGAPRIADAAGRFSCVDRRPSPASARPSLRCAQWRITP